MAPYPFVGLAILCGLAGAGCAPQEMATLAPNGCATRMTAGVPNVQARDIHVYLVGTTLKFDVCVVSDAALYRVATSVAAERKDGSLLAGMAGPILLPEPLPARIVASPKYLMTINGGFEATTADPRTGLNGTATVTLTWQLCDVPAGNGCAAAKETTAAFVLAIPPEELQPR